MQLNRTRILGTLLAAGLATLALGGCAAIGSEDAAGRQGVIWDAPLDVVSPPSPERRSLYVQFMDASGRGIEMRDELRRKFEERGYEIARNPDIADYKIQVTILSLDRREAGDRRDGTSYVLEGGTYRLASEVGGGILPGRYLHFCPTGTGEGLFREGVKNRTTAKEWVLVATFTLAEYKQDGVQTTINSGTQSCIVVGSSRPNASGWTAGSTKNSSGKEQNYAEMRSHLEFTRTLTAYHTKWDLKEAEAREVLIERLVEAAANALPAAI